MSKYYSIHEFSKIIGVSAQTLRNWDVNGKLHPHHTTVSGYRYYSDEQLNQVINVKPKKRITIGYCRVSSHKQKDDLERQITSALQKRMDFYRQAKYTFNAERLESYEQIGESVKKLKLLLDK